MRHLVERGLSARQQKHVHAPRCYLLRELRT